MKKVLLSALFCFSVSAVSGQVHEMGQIVVTASKNNQNIQEITSSVSVITRDDIEKSGKNNASELLRSVPGISVSRASGPGSITLVYLRGAQPGRTMVLIDGVEARDPVEIDGGFFDFANISTANIERIEIIRGPQSALYGSSAMAGVINIITKKNDGRLAGSVKTEGGSFNTYSASVLAGAGGFHLSGSQTLTRGFSAAEPGEESDGSVLKEAGLSYNKRIGENAGVEASVRRSALNSDIDDGASADDPNHTIKKNMQTYKAAFNQRLAGNWSHKFTFGLYNTKRVYKDEPDPLMFEDMDAWYKGAIFKADWHNIFSVLSKDDFSLGTEYQKDSGESFYRSSSSWGDFEESFTKKSAENSSVYAQYRPVIGENFFATLGARGDLHQYFDENVSYGASAAYFLPFAETKISASAGTGFKAPSVYQLFSDYGDKNLKPEQLKSYEAGIDQGFLSGMLNMGAGYFYNSYDELIQFSPPLSKYSNVSKAVTKGVEADVKYVLFKRLALKGGYTYMDTLDKSAGRKLLIRPQSTASGGFDWEISERLSAGVMLNYTGKNIQYMPWPDLKTSGSYTVTDVSLNYKAGSGFSVFARGENVFDKKYQEVYGYKSPGSAYYGGCKLAFGQIKR